MWFTTDPAIAAKLLDPAAAAAVVTKGDQRFRVERPDLISESVAADADIIVPARPGLTFRGYQLAGIKPMSERAGVLLADDMGIGKTIQVAGLINYRPELRRILILCNSSLRINWLRELQKWLVNKYNMAMWNSEVCRPAYVDISIIHYDVAWKFRYVLRSVKWDLVVADEVHLLKNPAALRTRAILGLDARTAKREETIRKDKLATYLPGVPVPKKLLEPVEPLEPIRGLKTVGLTGTPMQSRPKEGWPIFHWLDPRTFNSKTAYMRQFCDAFYNGYGSDADGASNERDLGALLRSTIMIRRTKAQVMTELPAKQRAVIEIPHSEAKVVATELEAFQAHKAAIEAMQQAIVEGLTRATTKSEEYAASVRNLKAATLHVFSKLAKQRKDTAIAKIPYVLEHLRNMVDAGEKVIVFAHHHEMIEAILEEFGSKFVGCYGKTQPGQRPGQRQWNVDRFQNDPDCLGIVGSYPVMGVGYTLVASCHVIAAELDWVPGNMTQAEDRAHRMGQSNMVLVEHLVLEGSLDAHMATIVVEKQEVLSKILDMEGPAVKIQAALPAAAAPVALDEADPGARSLPVPEALPGPETAQRARPLVSAQQLSLLEADPC